MPLVRSEDACLVSVRIVLIQVKALQLSWLGIDQLSVRGEIEACALCIIRAKREDRTLQVHLLALSAIHLHCESDGCAVLQLHVVEWIGNLC